MNTTFRLLAVIAFSTAVLRGSAATLDFAALPSVQGWSYVGSRPENSIFSVSSGLLTQNSLGIGGNSAYYRLGGAIDTNLSFSVAFRSRLLESQFGSADDPRGFAVQVDYGSQAVGVGLGPDRVVVFGPSGQQLLVNNSVDTSEFHSYLLRGRPKDHSWELLVDGRRLGGGVTEPGTFPNAVYFGDLADGRNALGEWSRLTVESEPLPYPGSLDTTFNADALAGSVLALAVQPDQHVVVGGSFVATGTLLRNLARLKSDGVIDRSFDAGTGPNDSVSSIALQPDGKVLIGGSFTAVNGIPRTGIARLNGDGSVDLNFYVSEGLEGTVRAIKVQPDGRVLVAGLPFLTGPGHPCVRRYLPNGELDESFVAGVEGGVNAMELLPNGRICITGPFGGIVGGSGFYLARLLPDGSVDQTFAPTGFEGSCLALQPDGKLIVGGFGGVLRFDQDGVLDEFFVPLDPGADPEVQIIAVQPDGRVLLGGVNFHLYIDETTTTRDTTLFRVESDGSLDASFQGGTRGYAALAVVKDGKILAGIRGSPTESVIRLNNPPILSISTSGGSLSIRWNAIAPNLVLQATSTLSAPNWQRVTEPAVLVNGTVSVTLPANQPSRFFRVVQQP